MNISSSLVCEGIKDFGLSETLGPESNAILLAIIQESIPEAKDDSKVSWCGIWLKTVVARVAEHFPTYEIEIPKKYMVAREWLKVGSYVLPDEVEVGDIAIFWRESPDSWKGHVGIYTGEAGAYYNIMGGNQGNKVSIMGYHKNRLLGFRRLSPQIGVIEL